MSLPTYLFLLEIKILQFYKLYFFGKIQNKENVKFMLRIIFLKLNIFKIIKN